MPWYTTADARRDAERQGAQKEKTMQSQLPEPLCNLPKYCQDAIHAYVALKLTGASLYTEGHCVEKLKKGGCQLQNLHCGYPACDRRPHDLRP